MECDIGARAAMVAGHGDIPRRFAVLSSAWRKLFIAGDPR
jgi:hypothetical protein